MKLSRNKTILTDVDGVLLDWSYAFDLWMNERGYYMSGPRDSYEREVAYEMPVEEMRKLIAHFNSSAAIGFLPPLRDAMYYVRKLMIEHGYRFRVITSLSKCKHAQHLRTKNLKMLFGKRTFESFEYLPTAADKDEVLEQYRGSDAFWLEDKLKNAEAGEAVGLRPIVVAGDFNVTDKYPRFWKWKDIYEYILKENNEI